MISQRDAFISCLFEKAKTDNDVIMISVDMGAAALDQWREELPDQFFAAGISEQNAINFAAGLAATGKKVYVYFMACWAARCFEQIRYSCALAENPITILGYGHSLGYAPAGAAHNPTEDIAYMRSLCGIEIYSPSNNSMVRSLVELTYDDPKLRYVRLERKQTSTMETVYPRGRFTAGSITSGMGLVKTTLSAEIDGSLPKICILSTGYMLDRVYKVWEDMAEENHELSVVDLWKIKPINEELFRRLNDKTLLFRSV